MTTRTEVILEARSWLRTPWRHQGRRKGLGCDCIGHIICTAKACGLLPAEFDVQGYSPFPDPPKMRKYLSEFLDPVRGADKRGGDVLWLMPRHVPQHLAIYTFDDTIIHAIDRQRGVREHRLENWWKIVAVYRFRGLDD